MAEGVETAESHMMLNGLGCTMGQGWTFGRPAPAPRYPARAAAAPAPVSGRWENSRESSNVVPVDAQSTQSR